MKRLCHPEVRCIKYMRKISILVTIVLICSAFVFMFPSKQEKKLFGRVEAIKILPEDVTLLAKMDTGAKTSSLSAIDIIEYEDAGRLRVAFSVVDPKRGIKFDRDLPVKRHAKIKKRKNRVVKPSGKPTFSVRPVVTITVELNGKTQEIDVNLVDRRHFNYPMLFGREALIVFDGVVDPSKQQLSNYTDTLTSHYGKKS